MRSLPPAGLRTAVFLLTLALALGVAPNLMNPTSASANITPPVVTNTTTICGTIVSYLPAAGFSSGYLVMNGPSGVVSYFVAPGVLVSGAPMTPLTFVCVTITTDASGAVISAVVTPGYPNCSNFPIIPGYPFTPCGIPVGPGIPITPGYPGAGNPCGTVVAYVPATATTQGTLVLTGITGAPATYIIAPGSLFVGAAITTGSNICIQPVFDAFGRLVGGTVSVTATANLNVCGQIVAYTPATGNFPGSITLAGTSGPAVYPIAPSVVLGRLPLVIGSNNCLQATTNGVGQIIIGAIVGNQATNLSACGTVVGYTPATTASAGAITLVSGTTSASYPIAVGTVFTGAGIALGANVCIVGSRNATGQIISGTVSVPLSATVYSGSGFYRWGNKFAG